MINLKLGINDAEVITERAKADMEQSYEQLEHMVRTLSTFWRRKFNKEVILDRYHYYSANYYEFFIRIGGDTLSAHKSILIVNNRSGSPVYSGVIIKEPQYYIKLVKRLRAERTRAFKSNDF